MNAIDLALGDWVYNSSKEKCKVYAISNMFDSNIHLDNYDKPNDGCFELVFEVEPIPLTPEILEKNGFENIGDDTYQLEEKPCWFWVDFFKHTYGCEYDTSTYEYEDDEHRLKLYGIPSVHELQHALRLCGIKKEIVL